MNKATPNPAPELFTTYERVETCHRVEVTAENIVALAQYFKWSVSFTQGEAALVPGGGTNCVKIGDWVDHRGSRWNPEPLTQGWSPAGTYLGGGIE